MVSVMFSWTAATDGQTTASDGLSYNLRVGTTPGGSDVVGPMSINPTSGQRKIAQRGLIQGTSWTLQGLVPGQTYYWSVQAIDTALAGSPFAAEGRLRGRSSSSYTDRTHSLPCDGARKLSKGEHQRHKKSCRCAR